MCKCGSSVGDGAFPMLFIFRLAYPGITGTFWGASIGPFFGLGLIQHSLALMILWSAGQLMALALLVLAGASATRTGLTLPHPLAQCQSRFSGLVDTAETCMSVTKAREAWRRVFVCLCCCCCDVSERGNYEEQEFV